MARKNPDLPEVKLKREKRRDEAKYLKWWIPERGEDAQKTLWSWIDRQRSTWSLDAINDLIAEAVYSDTPIAAGGRIGEGGRYIGVHSGMNPINKIKSLVDTGTAHLTKVRSMPVISADDADYDEKRYAREQSRVLRRKMGNGDMETVQPELVRDFLIRGSAAGKVERANGDTQFVRTPFYELVYDRREALYAKRWDDLTSLAHVRPEDREKLIAKWPAYEDEIRKAIAFTRVDPWMTYTYVGPNVADLVEVAEAWHLPSGPDADDGQHIICVRGQVICREPWDCPRHVVRPCYWTPPTRGVGRGTGLVVEQAAAQSMVNDILSDAREAIHHGSQLKVFMMRGSGVNKHHLKAKHPAVIETDSPPGSVQYVAPDPVSKQAWEIAFQLLQQMDLTSGIPQWASGSTSPLGANPAAKAIETMEDIKSERFAAVESGFQQWRVQIGQAHLDVATYMHLEAIGEIEKRFPEQPEPIAKKDLAAWIRDNKWPDVDVDGGDYHLTLEPENFIVGARSGKLEQVNEAAKSGLIPDPSLAAALFDEPDINRVNRSIIGPVRRIEQCLSDCTDLKVPYSECAPDPEMNHSLALLMVTGEIEQTKADKAKDEIVQRLRDFKADVERQLKLKQANSAPSLPGAQQNNIVAQPNAGTLMPQGAPAAQPMPGPGMPPPGGMPS